MFNKNTTCPCWLSGATVPYIIACGLATLFFGISAIFPYQMSPDVAVQLKSVQQFIDGTTPMVNMVTMPDFQDLSLDQSIWIRWWPPGVPVIFLPLAMAGLPLGVAVKITAYLFFITGSIGWLTIADKAGVGLRERIVFAFVIPLFSFSIVTLTMLWADVLPFGFMPWLMLYALSYRKRLENADGSRMSLLMHACLLGLLLGFVVWIKYSVLFVSLGILLYLAIYIFLFTRTHPLLKRCLLFITMIIGFLLPLYYLAYLNTLHTGGSSSVAELSCFFSQRKPLTDIAWLVTSFFGSFGLVLFQAYGWIMHLTCHSSIFFPSSIPTTGYDRVMLAARLGLPLSVIFLWFFFTARKFINRQFFLFACCVTLVPFACLLFYTIVSWWNILIFGVQRYTSASIIIAHLLIIISFISFSGGHRKGLGRMFVVFLVLFCFCLPILFYLGYFFKDGVYDKVKLHYAPGKNYLFTPELSKNNARFVIATIKRALRSKEDVVVFANIDTYGSTFGSWLEIGQRSIALTTNWYIFSYALGQRSHLENSAVFLTSRDLRVVLVFPHRYEEEGIGEKVKKRFPQAKEWIPVLNDRSVEDIVSVWYADLKT
ncbi:MAG: hypothetical protein KBA46_02770 [Candidatus Omnitrophica bacterium]|nr:hypothetical protein [Candidatus Omnitrophota bacterium]